MSELALLHKFNHWSEVLSVLTYSDCTCRFLSAKKGIKYRDPKGTLHITESRGSFDPNTVLVINGSIHLETFPLSKGKIPYSSLPYKIAIEHTTGYSPWDFLQMIELAEISASKSENAQGSKVLYLMNQKCYERFMGVDWTARGKDYYESWKSRIRNMIDKGYVIPESIEPAQYWLQYASPSRQLTHSDHICLCLNWCNLNKVVKIKQIVEICEKLHKYSERNIDIRLHSYARDVTKYFETMPYVTLIPYESMSKYDLMDTYDDYFVDGTGLGYEISYRNRFAHREVNIFYLNGLSSDEPFGGFDGIVEMGAVPRFTYEDFLKGQETSDFSNEIIYESFPHDFSIPDSCADIILSHCDHVKSL